MIRKCALLFAAWTAFGLLSSAHFFFAENGITGHVDFRDLLDNVLIFYWGWALLTPAVIHIARKYTLASGISVRTLLVLVVSAAAVTVAHGVVHIVLVLLFRIEGYKHLDTSALREYVVRHGGGDIATFAVIVGVVFIADEKRKASERVAANAALQARLARADLEVLRWQLHPHFLFNALNTVSTLVLQHQTDKAERAISLISKYLRAALDQRPDTTVRLADELSRIERYMEIERMRFGDSIRFDVQATDAAVDARLPSEVLQPLLENAIVHGAVRDDRSDPIVLKAQLSGERLLLSVSNPVAAKEDQEVEGAGNGFGLRYVRERLIQFYGPTATFDLGFENGRATARLNLPYTTEARGTA